VKNRDGVGGYAATAITALTAQNTLGVEAVLPIDPDFVEKQMEVVLVDIGSDAIKVGMLGSRRPWKSSRPRRSALRRRRPSFSIP
jgi:hydroxymethylpyrimidine/phosphomethylpyrimidine kinase